MSIILTHEQEAAVQQLAHSTGKTEQDLLREAVDRFLREATATINYHAALNAAFGMWKDHPTVLEDLQAGRKAIQARMDANERQGR